MSQVLRVLLGVSVFMGMATAIADTRIVPLSTIRERLTVPGYTKEEREALLTQVGFVFRNLYVNRDLKIQDFGQGIDPLPKLESLRAQAANLNGLGFHQKMGEIFSGLHDLHTTYSAPRPLACALGLLPVRFESVRDGNGDAIVVTGKAKLNIPELADISIGDKLLEVDGKPVESALQDLSALSGGANPAAMRFRSMQLLSVRSFRSHPVPVSNTVTLKWQRDLKTFEKKIPWYTAFDEECLFGEEEQVEDLQTKMLFAEDDYQKRFNRIFGVPTIVGDPQTWSESNPFEEIFQVGTISSPSGKLGYIRLKAFYWEDRRLDLETIVEGLRRAVEEKLNDAIGLVIDVRGNPGGHLILAEKLVQLFSPAEVEPSTVRMLANPLNEKIFLKANGGDNRWSVLIRETIQAKNKYTNPIPITPASVANTFGQVWFRPVVILTDAACFSACDIFAAGIQDSGAGVVIGLQRNTGGGGANVMEYDTFRRIWGSSPDNPFESLPRDQSLRVSWRQTLRSGKNKGVPIEGKGVEADVVIPLSRADLGGQSKELMRQVYETVLGLQPKYQSGLVVRRGAFISLSNGGAAQWKEKVYGIDGIDLLVNGKKIHTISVPFSAQPSEVEISVPSLVGNWKDLRVVLVGKRSGKTVFRVIRELMWRGEYTPIPEEGGLIDFNQKNLGPLKTVLLNGPVGSGWQIAGGELRVGPGPLYQNGVFARAFLPLRLDGKGGRFILDVGLKAEELNDSLRIYLVNPQTGDRINYFAGSHLSRKKVGAKLPPDWDRADLVFEFESDENWAMEGPAIGKIALLRAE